MRRDPVETGAVLAGRYRVERALGRGAMGMVVAATQLGLERLVAIKFMSGVGARSSEARARFQREARVASLLRSAHAGKIIDVGELPDGVPYIVMEFLDGQDLAAVSQERGPLPAAEAVALVLQACEAVAEAHALGIVHRDLKPANLFLTVGPGGSPQVKVLDFGVSKLADAAVSLTTVGQLLGSPLYMSPEQFESAKEVDARSDVWALGVILYELLAAAPPFQSTKLMELCRKVSAEAPVPLERHRPDLPAGLCAVILGCLEKDRDRRWPSVAAFAAALAPYAPASAAAYVDRIACAQHVPVLPALATTRLPQSTFGDTAGPLVASSPPASTRTFPSWRSSPARALGALTLGGAALTLMVGLRLPTAAPSRAVGTEAAEVEARPLETEDPAAGPAETFAPVAAAPEPTTSPSARPPARPSPSSPPKRPRWIGPQR